MGGTQNGSSPLSPLGVVAFFQVLTSSAWCRAMSVRDAVGIRLGKESTA